MIARIPKVLFKNPDDYIEYTRIRDQQDKEQVYVLIGAFVFGLCVLCVVIYFASS